MKWTARISPLPPPPGSCSPFSPDLMTYAQALTPLPPPHPTPPEELPLESLEAEPSLDFFAAPVATPACRANASRPPPPSPPHHPQKGTQCIQTHARGRSVACWPKGPPSPPLPRIRTPHPNSEPRLPPPFPSPCPSPLSPHTINPHTGGADWHRSHAGLRRTCRMPLHESCG